jgi:hypothetical protein
VVVSDHHSLYLLNKIIVHIENRAMGGEEVQILGLLHFRELLGQFGEGRHHLVGGQKSDDVNLIITVKFGELTPSTSGRTSTFEPKIEMQL